MEDRSGGDEWEEEERGREEVRLRTTPERGGGSRDESLVECGCARSE